MPDNKQQLAIDLGAIIELQSSHLEQMLELLKKEHYQISKDPETLTSIAVEKHKQVQFIEQQTVQHNKLLQQAGFTADQSGMKNFIHWCGSPHKLMIQWETLLNKIEKCQENNLRNGMLVEMSHNRLTQIADIFQGEEKQTRTYNQSGKNDSAHIPGSVSIKA
ncbi:hypothetical protein MNBD_GAMMA12-3747 [hydrothermal vent metagenome]|uniref:Flagellar biosynthesis protein FlgN n=1 Tax=hydrothermal vent metagenome TaxID=652676 RepID=A0A3B0YF32_9ZZZZ